MPAGNIKDAEERGTVDTTGMEDQLPTYVGRGIKRRREEDVEHHLRPCAAMEATFIALRKYIDEKEAVNMAAMEERIMASMAAMEERIKASVVQSLVVPSVERDDALDEQRVEEIVHRSIRKTLADHIHAHFDHLLRSN